MRLAYPTRTLLHVCGLPGAGKSWLMRERLSEAGVRCLDLDSLRAQLGYDPAGAAGFGEAIEEMERRVRVYAQRGHSLAVEHVGIRDGLTASLLARTDGYGYQAHALMVDAPAWQARLGQLQRRRALPPEVWRFYREAWASYRDGQALLGPGQCESVVRLTRSEASRASIEFYG